MKKEYVIAYAIILGSIIIASATYLGATKQMREAEKVCQEVYVDDEVAIKECTQLAKFGFVPR